MCLVLTRLEMGKARNRRAAVPRANVLANIAAEDVAANGLAKFQWNGCAQFDRQVGNASACVEHVGLNDCAGGARVNAQAAISAQIGRGRVFFF
jgi:hypothetical protein